MSNPYTADFPYIKTFEISVNPGLGYQVKLVDSSGNSLVTYENEMQTAFQDIRFCDEEDNQLSYWIESKTDSTSAEVWVKLASATATQIILNYGNEAATSVSSIENTMEFGDEFATLNAEKWTVTGENVSVTDGICSLSSTVTSSVQKIVSSSTFTPPWTYGAKVSLSGEQIIQLGCRPDLSASEGAIITVATTTDNLYALKTINNNSATETNVSIDNNPHKIEIKTTSGSTSYFVDGSLAADPHTTNNPDGAVPVRFAVSRGDQTTEAAIAIDYVYIRKYIATEPYFTANEEEPVNYIYPILEYNEENEMFQIVGTQKSHPVQIRSLTTGELATTATSPTFTIYVNGTLSEESVTISAYNNTMLRFLVNVPAALAVSPYDSVEINVSCDEGEGFLMVNIAPPPSLIATAVWSGTEGAAVHTATTSTLTLAAINAEVDTAISDAALATASALSAVGGNVDLIKAKTDLLTLAAIKTQAAGALTDFDTATPIAKTSELATITGGGTATLDSLETDISEISITGTSAVKVVHPDYYAFDASEKTITLSSPYNTVTVEQVLRIKDLTTNYIIYDCEDSKYDDIPISIVDGVLTYTAPARDAADTDLLQITFNMV